MKTIEVDDELYRYIAGQTRHIGESASDILRRLLDMTTMPPVAVTSPVADAVIAPSAVDGLPDVARLAAEESSIGRFMLILSALYRIRPEQFSQAAELKGRKRLYLARSPEDLLANGTTTKPKPVPDTPYWVISNTNTARKRYIVSSMMTAMGYPVEQVDAFCQQI